MVNFKIYLFLMNTSVVLSAFTNNVVPPEGASKIVGGHEAKPHSHPYLVSLQLRFLWVRMHLCGGALLNERWVLTAAHCVIDSWLFRWLPVDAVAGIHDVDNFGASSQVIRIDKRIKHPLYKGSVGPNDIALMKTEAPFKLTKEIQPVKIPPSTKINQDSFTLSGWGALKTTYFIPDLPSKLQEVDVTYISYKECYEAIEELKEENEENPLDDNANICTGPLTGGVAACNGDSGGPLIEYRNSETIEISNDPVYPDEIGESSFNDTDKIDYIENGIDEVEDQSKYIEINTKQRDDEDIVPIVVGVVSWGISPCGEKGAPTVYTKVSNYIDFINEYINT